MALEDLVETKLMELGADEWRARQPFTIFRVPAYVRERSRSSYEPRMVSIGPYYHGAAELRSMEDHKWRYLHDCLRRNPTVTASVLVREMRALEARARACYGERPASLDADAFALMLLLDGCFILEFFFKWHDKEADTLCDVGWGLSLVLSDLLLMENQIPFFVLVKLYEIIASTRGGSKLILNLVKFIAASNENKIEGEDQPADEINHLLHLYYKSFVPERNTTPRATSRATELINHLLHLYYKSFVTQRTTSEAAAATTIPRATELSEVGVRFARRVSSPRDRFYVKFDGSRGVLEIPTIEKVIIETTTTTHPSTATRHKVISEVDAPQYRTEHAHPAKIAFFHFTGKLVDGTEFVSSKQYDAPLRFILGKENVMRGFDLAVSSMKPGEKAMFSIPPELAVTRTGSPASIPSNIPPDQTVQFEIELISLFTIYDIIGNEGLLKKTINCPASDIRSTSHMNVVYVKYNACLEDGTSVSKSDGVEFSLANGFFCPAFTHAVENMEEREEAILIVEPEYAFGELGRPSQGDEVAVPPGATLYVHLKFVSWIRQIRVPGEDHTIILKKTLSFGDSPGTRTQSQAAVRVRLLGKLQDGAVFDRRGHDEEEPFKFVVDEGNVVDNLDEAVMTMEEGEVAEFTFPTKNALDAAASGHEEQRPVITANSELVVYQIELLSVVNEKHPEDIVSRAEVMEKACIKEKEGDSYFNLGKYLRAHRRYYKGKQILKLSRYFNKEDRDELKQMVVSFALKAAKCAIHLQCYSEAQKNYKQVIRYDAENIEAKQMMDMDIDTMHRGFEEVFHQVLASCNRIGKRDPRILRDDSFVPHVAAPGANSNGQAASTTTTPGGAGSPATQPTLPASATPGVINASSTSPVRTVRTAPGNFLFQCFGSSPTTS